MPNPYRTIFSTVSSRTKRGICFFFLLALWFASTPLRAQTPPKRPRILGISSVKFATSDGPAAAKFYRAIAPNARIIAVSYVILPTQQEIVAEQQVVQAGHPLLQEITFWTSSIHRMDEYLLSHRVPFIEERINGDLVRVHLKDPEEHEISFVQVSSQPANHSASNDTGTRIPRLIHAGFIVRDREKMEHFYKDILGFRPYWHGGMKDDETSWVSLQVPDGTDWLEFMLYDPTGRDKHFLGVMNHIALGVTDIHATQEQLRKNGAPLTEEPKIGRDGKWQLNLYDPDETRIEFMEFTPVQKPCCSEFTAPHPKP